MPTAPSSRASRRQAVPLVAIAVAASVACSDGDNGYALDVIPAELTFTAEQNGTTPAARTLTATYGGEGIVVGYPPDVTAPDWIDANLTGESAGAITVSVGIATTGLTPGRYATTLRFATGKADGSKLVLKDVPITYVVTAGLQASATSLAYTALDGIAPAPQSLRISSATASDSWALSVEGYTGGAADWLSLSAAAGALANGSAEVMVGALPLEPGNYGATLVLKHSAGTTRARIPVTYAVTARLQASATSIAFAALDGIASAPQSLRISSPAASDSWALSVEGYTGGAADWLSLSATAGALASGPADVDVSAAPLEPGNYGATLVLKDGAGAVKARIPVVYQVAPAFTVSGTLAARVTEAATLASLQLPLTLRTAVDAANGAGHRWQATSSVDWLTVLPASGDLAADTALTIQLDPDRLWALANGNHAATVTLASVQGGSTRVAVPVALTVALAPVLSAGGGASGLTFSVGLSTTAADIGQSVAISSNLGEAFAAHGGWHAVADVPWLQPTPSTGGQALGVSLVPAELAALPNGQSRGIVAIQPDDARVAGATVAATLALALADVSHLAPYATWVGRAPSVIVRGGGFPPGESIPVLFGSETATGTAVSPTELHVTAPVQATAGRVPVRIGNGLGVVRSSSELVVLAAPAYASHQAALTVNPTRMTLDPERQAVLLSGSGGEIQRFRFDAGAWIPDTFQAPSATGAYVALDGKTLFVTSGSTGSSSNVFLELDPVTLAVRKTTGHPTYYERYDFVAGFNDGRVLAIDTDQWVATIWYPSLTKGLYVDASTPLVLVTRDRNRMIVSSRSSSARLSSYDVGDAATRTRSIAVSPYSGYDWSVSGDGGRFVVGSAVYDRDFGFLGSVKLPETGSPAVAVSPDGATLYTLTNAGSDWVFRRASIGGVPPYAAEVTPLQFSIAPSEYPAAMAVSEDGSTLFLLTRSGTGSLFRALPL